MSKKKVNNLKTIACAAVLSYFTTVYINHMLGVWHLILITADLYEYSSAAVKAFEEENFNDAYTHINNCCYTLRYYTEHYPSLPYTEITAMLLELCEDTAHNASYLVDPRTKFPDSLPKHHIWQLTMR